MGMPWDSPIKLLCDNKLAIEIAKNPLKHDHTKHIKVNIYFIKENLTMG